MREKMLTETNLKSPINRLVKTFSISMFLGILLHIPVSHAHLHQKNVCWAHKIAPATIALEPLAKPRRLDQRFDNTIDFISYLSCHPEFTIQFMRCLSRTVDRFPVLRNGFSLSFEDARHNKPKHPLFLQLRAPLFYLGTQHEDRIDSKQSIRLKQAYDGFHEYRRVLNKQKHDTVVKPNPNMDIKYSPYSIAFRERDGDIVIIPKGPYVSLYDFAKKAKARELVDFWRMVKNRMKELEKTNKPYTFMCQSGSAAGQAVPHAAVILKTNW